MQAIWLPGSENEKDSSWNKKMNIFLKNNNNKKPATGGGSVEFRELHAVEWQGTLARVNFDQWNYFFEGHFCPAYLNVI